MAICLSFSPTSRHLHSLQVKNCHSNWQLVVDEDENGKFRLERVKETSPPSGHGEHKKETSLVGPTLKVG